MKRSGKREWVHQRLSAVALAAWVLPWLAYWLVTSPTSLEAWQRWAFQPMMKVLGTLGLAAFVVHAWIGLWTVVTDYVPRGRLQCVATMMLCVGLPSMALVGVWLLWA